MMNAPLPDLGGEHWTEPVPPETHSLVTDVDATLEQQVLDLTQRQRISNVHHHRQTDDLGRRVEITEGISYPRKLRNGPDRLKPIWSDNAGETGRYRTNVWDYPGISSLGENQDAELAMHPTVKPVAFVADAIKDCSKRGAIVLDPFADSGTTLIAAEKVDRAARLIEYDPAYCDTIVRRWEILTGKRAMLDATGARFEDVEDRPL